jgi:hypothetical protein
MASSPLGRGQRVRDPTAIDFPWCPDLAAAAPDPEFEEFRTERVRAAMEVYTRTRADFLTLHPRLGTAFAATLDEYLSPNPLHARHKEMFDAWLGLGRFAKVPAVPAAAVPVPAAASRSG